MIELKDQKDQFEIIRSKDSGKNDQNNFKNDQDLPSTRSQGNQVAGQPSRGDHVAIRPSRNTTTSQYDLVAVQPSRNTTTLKLNNANWYKLYNDLDDYIIPNLDTYEQSIFRRIYRLSYGFNRDITDAVSVSKLAEKCNIGTTKAKEAIKTLEAKGYIQVLSDKSGNPKGGNRYRINLDIPQESSSNQDVVRLGRNATRSQHVHIKDHHDDLKKTNHHQSEHEKDVMTIYQNVTSNSWSKADLAAYEKIKNISIEVIETAIKLASERSSARPNSLAYFVKEILSVANPKQNRSQRKKMLAKIIDRISNSLVGSSYSMSDFTHKVKDLCLREDIAFDNDIFDEIMSKKNG